MDADLVVKNGRLVTSEAIFEADFAVKDSKIISIDKNIKKSAAAEKVIEAEGKYILPGIIDVHNHMEHGSGYDVTVDDFASGSKAGAAGGVTTFMDFAIQNEDHPTIEEAFLTRKNSADSKTVIDYSLHIALMDIKQEILEEIPEAISKFSSSFKLFMTYSKLGFMVEDEQLLNIMEIVSEENGMVGVHAENDPMIEYMRSKYIREGKTEPIYHSLSRPNISESEAINRAIKYSSITNCPLYIFHLSTEESLEIVRRARKKGINVNAETNPHYLLLDREYYKRPDGQNFIMSPPLRSKNDNEVLWNGLKQRDLNIISTDHCPYHKKHKKEGKADFREVSPGIPGIELLLPLVHSEGVLKGNLSLMDMVDLLSYQPAKEFGFLPEKGTLNVGSDADFVIFDSEKKCSTDPEDLYMNSDYNPYEEFELKGLVEKTYVRGELVFSREQGINVQEGSGNYIYR